MNRILTEEKAFKISKKLKREGKKIVLSGGVFDILHLGHIKFLQAAKKRGDILFVFLESDENVKRHKGNNRPINSQVDRAVILSSLRPVDYVVCLTGKISDKDYDNLVIKLKPDIIATTKQSSQEIHNIRQAKLINAEVALVVKRISDKSTTRIAEIIKRENDL